LKLAAKPTSAREKDWFAGPVVIVPGKMTTGQRLSDHPCYGLMVAAGYGMLGTLVFSQLSKTFSFRSLLM
jgi:hypothetical protein